MHGEGHGLTKYASQRGNASGWGEEIFPYTEQEAREWAEKSLTGEEYEIIFGVVAE